MKAASANDSPRCDCGSKNRRIFLVVALLAALTALFFRKPITEWITARAILSNEAPSEEALRQAIQTSTDPQAELIAAWNTGKIVPRELAIHAVSTIAPADRPCPPALESVLATGALDPDENVRETSLAELKMRRDPALPALAAAQLTDTDPRIRLLGLQYLRDIPAKIALPLAVPLLEDPDPAVIGDVLDLMNTWSGEDFGVKVRDILPVADPITGVESLPPERVQKARAGVGRAKAWLANHRSEFDSTSPATPTDVLAAMRPVRAGDFALPSLDGHSVRLSDFRGKVVVLNFWTTWCTACIRETPELVQLQKQSANNLAIVGISLDNASDDEQSDKPPSPREIHDKVARAARQRGINYTVLLDQKGSTGARFNGAELPTTVIIDAEGNVRRRFVGARNMAVFTAFIAAASQPLAPPLSSASR
jgi:thiol-disulfide isomerase/thioredoxin